MVRLGLMSVREHVSTFFQAVASKLHGVEVDIKIVKRKGDLIDPEPGNRNATRATPKESVKCELSLRTLAGKLI
jgi:hypothetical protein